MKKLLTLATLAALMLVICLHADTGYDGPRDDTIYWARYHYLDYRSAMRPTTLGILARYSDVIGIGTVSDKINDHFTVTVGHALVGCTNGAVIVVKASIEGWGGDYEGDELVDYMPTNNSLIVFAAHTNAYHSYFRMYWNHAEIPATPEFIRKQLSIRYLNRSWWHVERDDGLLLTQFTNVIQAVRFDRNWTNYFHLCRDGANVPSNRVKEDSFWDLRVLSQRATDEKAQFMLDDPLVDPKHKEMILIPDWRYPEENYSDN